MAKSTDQTFKELAGVATVRLEVSDAHLEPHDFVAWSDGSMTAERRLSATRHLDQCDRCREVVAELHRDDDGSAPTHTGDPLVGQLLGEYRVDELLARGGMGAVYRGEQPVIGKKVAIKVLLPEASKDPDQVNRLLQEARAVNAIRHPNIIDIFSFGALPGGQHYFVMELLAGQPLNQLLRTRGRLTPGEVLTVLEQSLAALGAAHAADVIHRDLKPANLFVTPLPGKGWHVTVLDFGLAKQLRTRALPATSPDLVMGTPGFMAPEQILGEPLTPKADIYALGCLAWLLVAGREVHEADSVMDLLSLHLDQPVPSLISAAPGCPPSLAALIERLLSRAPEARPSALEALTALARVRRELGGQDTLKMQPPAVVTTPSAPSKVRAPEPTQVMVAPAVETKPDRPNVKRAAARTELDTPVLRRGPGPLVIAAAIIAVGLAAFGAWAWWDARTPPADVGSTPLRK